MGWIFFIPFIIQGLLIGLDEYVFHVKRGLPKWERIGHPIDTLSVLICLGFALLFPFSINMLKIYVILGIISCMMVTKDEFIHKHHCPTKEMWLHALLFIHHPIFLASAALVWAGSSSMITWLKPFALTPSLLHLFLGIQCAFVFFFFLYQLIYWNFLWKAKAA